GQGTGLGLSISYQIIVAKHGGQLRCVSAPGEGTEFIIQIPIRQRDRKISVSNQPTSERQMLPSKHRRLEESQEQFLATNHRFNRLEDDSYPSTLGAWQLSD
ncbi:MAG TPA: ATP-binding protein, partial [Coleofasciculaceae cyanobacterium]